MSKKTLRDVDLKGKRVLMRVDFNVPMDKDGSGKLNYTDGVIQLDLDHFEFEKMSERGFVVEKRKKKK